MKVDVEAAAGATIVRPTGRLDAVSSPQLTEALAGPLAAEAPRIILDLSSCAFVSSAGLRVILQGAKQAKKAGRFVVCGLSQNVKMVFDLAGLDRVMPICADVESAHAAMLG